DLIVTGTSEQVMNSYQIGDESMTYDKIGNIKTMLRVLKNTNPQATNPIIAFDHFNYNYQTGNNRLMSVTGLSGSQNRSYTYDVNGNMLTDSYKGISATTVGRAAYTYNLVKNSDAISYLYSLKDQRTYKKVVSTSGTTEEYYLMDAMGRTVALKNMQGNNWEYYVSAGEREARLKPTDGNGNYSYGEVQFFAYDHLGNTRVTYSLNMNPTTHETEFNIDYVADYYPYGKILREFVNGQKERFLTTQHERDAETGLDYRGARYYDSDVARFLSIDPWQDKYPAWSTYNYVMGNPIIFIDPTGKGPTDWVKNINTGEYIWDNTVTNQLQAHEGQRYIGNDDSDIINDLFGKSRFTAETVDYGIYNVENDLAWVASFSASVYTTLVVNIKADVTVDGDNRTFNGINFNASTCGVTYAPLKPDQQMDFTTTEAKFHGYDMNPPKKYEGTLMDAQSGSGAYSYSWSAKRVYNDFNKSYHRKISIEGYYTFGDTPLKHLTAAGLIIPINKTAVSLTLPFNNK
ncbi:MAG: RHS repeat-associated core domain-containing protein, partial [Crocinitomicaceae bacterium]|nr:RHS repeat-associated core domain-containing protein [Crocinitomicaceae bacterium]